MSETTAGAFVRGRRKLYFLSGILKSFGLLGLQFLRRRQKFSHSVGKVCPRMEIPDTVEPGGGSGPEGIVLITR